MAKLLMELIGIGHGNSKSASMWQVARPLLFGIFVRYLANSLMEKVAKARELLAI